MPTYVKKQVQNRGSAASSRLGAEIPTPTVVAIGAVFALLAAAIGWFWMSREPTPTRSTPVSAAVGSHQAELPGVRLVSP